MGGTAWPALVAGNRAKASEVELKFDWIEQHYYPFLSGTTVDATYDLGQPIFRWRDINLSRQILGGTGSAAIPSYARYAYTNVGIYFATTTMVTFAANGNDSFYAGSGQFLGINGQASLPSMSFVNSPTMGAYRVGANNFGLAAPDGKYFDVVSTGEKTLPLQPMFLAYKTTQANDVTGNGTIYTIDFNAEIFDQNNDFNNSTYTFTAPVTGKYFFSLVVQAGSPSTGTTYALRINTSNRTFRHEQVNASTESGANSVQFKALADMDAADTAVFQIAATGVGADTVDINHTSGSHHVSFVSGGLLA